MTTKISNLEMRIAQQLKEKIFNEALEKRYDSIKANLMNKKKFF